MAPSYNNAIGQLVYASGDDGAVERGADDPPVPERCCAICSGHGSHDGTNHTLYRDVLQTATLSCEGFELQFLSSASLNGWYCAFAIDPSASAPFVSTGHGTDASLVYVPTGVR